MFGFFKKKEPPKITAILVAAGSGTRMNSEKNKVFIEIADRPVIAHSLLAFQNAPAVIDIIVVTREEDILLVGDIGAEFNITKLSKVVKGGSERHESVKLGLQEIEDSELVLVHDAARPCIRIEDIEGVINIAKKHGAATLAHKVTDTLRYASDGILNETVDRESLWTMQTPQVFNLDILKKAHDSTTISRVTATDDVMLVQQLNIPVYIYAGSRSNIKITTPEDLIIAESIIARSDNNV